MSIREYVLHPDGPKNSKVLITGQWHWIKGTPQCKPARESFCTLLLGPNRLHPPGRKRTPVYQFHKPSGQAFVILDGETVYLKEHGSAESLERYRQLVKDWLSQNNVPQPQRLLTIGELILRYDDFALGYYVKNGNPTSEVTALKVALGFLAREFSAMRVIDFGPQALKQVRERMIAAGIKRKSINQNIGRIRRCVRWAVSEELVPVDVLQRLETVVGLRKNRTDAVESEPVRPVDEEHVNMVLPHLCRQVRDMVRLQLLTGCRPGEVRLIRPCDVDTSGEVWLYRPESHKGEHHEQDRIIFIGPRGQEILRPWLDRPALDYCFSPIEAERERQAERRKARKTPEKYGNRPGTNRKTRPKKKPGECYTTNSYRRAIQRTIQNLNEKRAEESLPLIPVWSLHQLRHSRGTAVRKTYGLEGSQLVLGHSSADVTQIYAERDLERAKQILLEIG